MSGGSAAARDLVYGRRGGRWAPSTAAPRSAKPAPDKSAQECKVCGARYDVHVDPCPLCGRDTLHHDEHDLENEVQARARMATARQAAGLELSELDEWALAEWAGHPLGRVGSELTR